MAHYAWINSSNIVINVTTGVDETVTQNGVGGSTEAWETFYTNAVNQEGVYLKRTSYNGNIRNKYAAVGDSYDATQDIFISPQPYPSWTKNPDTHKWEPPTPIPIDGNRYTWDEDTTSWVELPTE
jgi:hypothetical protein